MREPTRYNSLQLLHADTLHAFTGFSQALETAFQARTTAVLFAPFETYRTPIRQIWLLEQQPPRSRALLWRSPHQWGRAVDFVPVVNGEWTWNVPELEWRFMQELALEHGLSPRLAWDSPHIELL